MFVFKALAGWLALVATLLSLAHVSRGQAFKHAPDCSAIMSKATFFSYQIVCDYIAKDWKEDEMPLLAKDMNKWDIIETCACNLVSHELAWAAMITHETEALYLTIKKYVDDFDREAERSQDKTRAEDVKRSELMFQSPDGLRMYYWDRLDDILSNKCQNDDDFDDLMLNLMDTFSTIYYDPETFSHRFARQPRGQSARKLVSRTCNQLRDSSMTYLTYFDKLRQVAENDRLMFKLTAYSEDLHKVRTVMRLCIALSSSGQLIST